MDHDAELDPSAVEIGYFFPQEIDIVWRVLTEPELLERWFLRPVGFVPKMGTHFMFEIPAPTTGELACEVLAVRPGRQLTYSWMDMRAPRPARWYSDWSLEPQGRGSRLLVTQSGFDITDKRQKMSRNAVERGWRATSQRLRETLDDVSGGAGH